MIDIYAIAEKSPTQGVNEFMNRYGGNHVSLYDGWKKFPAMRNTRTLVELCLAYALQQDDPRSLVIETLIGRLRSIDRQSENQCVKEILNGKDAEGLLS